MKKGIFNVGNDGSVNTDSGVFIGNCCEDFKEYEEKGSSVVQLAKLGFTADELIKLKNADLI